MLTPSMVAVTTKNLSSAGAPSITSALMPILAIIWLKVPPQLLSFMPPVSGLLAPQEIRPEFPLRAGEGGEGRTLQATMEHSFKGATGRGDGTMKDAGLPRLGIPESRNGGSGRR
jgi:hypothetical protein